MARKSEGHLFDLIKSLTRGEKRTFRQLANYFSDGDKKYLFLFTLIDSQKQYDEGIIIQKLKKEKIFTHLPNLKIYLMELISKALRFHYSGKSIDSKLRNYMADIEIYHAKRLINLRDKTFEKVRCLAAKHENYEASLLSLNKEFTSKHLEIGEGILDEYDEINKKIFSRQKYRHLCYKCLDYQKKGAVRDKIMKTKWDKIINDPLLNNNSEPSGYTEKYYYHLIGILYGANNDGPEKIRYHAEMLVKSVESRPDWLNEGKIWYVGAITNFISALCALNEMDKTREVMNKLLLIQNLELNAKEKDYLTDSIILSYSNLLSAFISTNNFAKGLKVASEVHVFIKNKNLDYPNELLLLYNLTCMYLYTGNYKSALGWINILLNKSTPNREDIIAFAKIFNLIIHYELGHEEVLPYLVRSAYRFLHKRKKLYKTEDAILRFIRNKLPKANSKKELIGFFKKLKSELEEITKDAYEAKVFEYFDFISWLESKIQNKTMIEVLKEK